MSALLIVMTKVLKQEGWEPYQSQVGECFASYGGKYLVKRTAPDVMEGKFEHDRLTVFEFPTLQAIHDMWDSPEYRRIRPLRAGLGQLDIWAVQGTEA